MTDQELIKGILCHERKAFDFLVGRYQKQVIKTACYFVGDLAEAEDLSQEIFMDIIDSIGKFRGGASLSTWIYRITVNRSLNMLKRNKRRDFFTRLESVARGAGISSVWQQQEPGVNQVPMEEKETQALLYLAISRLSKNQRIAFTLHKLEELPYRDVAEVMEVSLASVESLIHRARMNLQKDLVSHFSEYAKK
jgi:RNA polymerase sigma factor (sigma-70 family)